MPVVGIGVDVVDIARFAQTLQRTPSVAERLFAEEERALTPARLAARFAAKEAVVKALGGPGGLSWRDVAVDSDERGRPLLRVSGRTAAAADRLGVTSWHVSLSHDAATAVAVVVAER